LVAPEPILAAVELLTPVPPWSLLPVYSARDAGQGRYVTLARSDARKLGRRKLSRRVEQEKIYVFLGSLGHCLAGGILWSSRRDFLAGAPSVCRRPDRRSIRRGSLRRAGCARCAGVSSSRRLLPRDNACHSRALFAKVGLPIARVSFAGVLCRRQAHIR
jgi:hypothetical protein